MKIPHRVVVVVAVFMISTLISNAQDTTRFASSTFNPSWLKTVISIEHRTSSKDWSPIGTGFLVITPMNHIILVTAKHVILDEANKVLDGLGYRINTKSHASSLMADTQLVRDRLQGWFISESTDVACRFVELSTDHDQQAIPLKMFLLQQGLEAGASAFVLGYPLGLRSEQYATPIMRKASIALSEGPTLLIDAAIYPGNSGGPVLYVPTIKVGGALNNSLLNEERLIGMVVSYIPYQETAISTQTRRPRMIFEENSGLAVAIPCDALLRLISRNDVRALDNILPQ